MENLLNYFKIIDHSVIILNEYHLPRFTKFTGPLTDKVILEMGCGNHTTFFVNAFCFENYGQNEVFAIDVKHYLENYEPSLFQKLVQYLKIKKFFVYSHNGQFLLYRFSSSSTNNNYSPSLSFLQMNASNMYFKNDMFDFVFSNAFLEHCKDIKSLFSELHRVVKKNGIVYFNWNPFTSLEMGAHDLGIPYYYPWAHLRCSKEKYLDLLNEIKKNNIPWEQVGLQHHNLFDHNTKNISFDEIYESQFDDLNKVRVREVEKIATEFNFVILESDYTVMANENFLTDEIRQELSQYDKNELLCQNNVLILQKV